MSERTCSYCDKKIMVSNDRLAMTLFLEHLDIYHPFRLTKRVESNSNQLNLTLEDAHFLRDCGISPFL